MTRRSASAVLKVVEGQGQAEIDGNSYNWDQHDVMAVPTHARVSLSNRSGTDNAFVFVVDDAPLHRKLGIYEEFK